MARGRNRQNVVVGDVVVHTEPQAEQPCPQPVSTLGGGAAIKAARLREARAAAERGDVRAAVLRLLEAVED